MPKSFRTNTKNGSSRTTKMDKKKIRDKELREELRKVIFQQHGDDVDPRTIKNTQRSRPPLQYYFQSDDPDHPKVSISAISEPEFIIMMRLIRSNMITATRIVVDEPADSSISTHTNFVKRSSAVRTASTSLQSVSDLPDDSGSAQFPFSRILNVENPGFRSPEPSSFTFRPILPPLRDKTPEHHPQSYPSAMVIDSPTEETHTETQPDDQMQNDIDEVSARVSSFKKSLGGLCTLINTAKAEIEKLNTEELPLIVDSLDKILKGNEALRGKEKAVDTESKIARLEEENAQLSKQLREVTAEKDIFKEKAIKNIIKDT
ncbi:hypothetical protein ABW20_dc0104652 [Dactylellina cionopaga]|nr:hypothetical protein ABW20_dc0104652 [Dactylellina cionopaga]